MAETRRVFHVEPDTPPRNILFVGDERIGKTTFIRRYCEHMRDYYRCDTYQGTFLVFTQFLFYLQRFERRIPIRFLDLPAESTEESRLDQYPSRINLIVLCFAIDDPASLTNVWQKWLPECRQYYPESAKYLLLGLKNDMRLELLAADRIPVTEERARQVHQRYEFSGDYLECSVEGNPAQARHCMDIIINDSFSYDSPRANN